MSWLADVFAQFFTVQDDGVAKPARAILNFGQGLDVADNPGAERLDVTVPTTSSTKAGLLPLTTGANKIIRIAGGAVTWGQLQGTDVDAAAAIPGGAVTPAFGAQHVSTTLSCTAAMFRTPPVSPAQLTGNVTDYAGIGANSLALLTSDAPRFVNTIIPYGDGHWLVICNVGGNNIVLLDDDGVTGTAAYRMILAASANQTLTPNTCLQLVYDPVQSRWRQIAPVT